MRRRNVNLFCGFIAFVLLISTMLSGSAGYVYGDSSAPVITDDSCQLATHDRVAVSSVLSTLKAVQRGDSLYIAVQGSGLDQGDSVIYIDSDNDGATGDDSPIWINSTGIDHKVVGDMLYAFADGQWTEVGQVVVGKSDEWIEVEINIALMGLDASQRLRVGFLKDGASVLPEIGSNMLSVFAAEVGGGSDLQRDFVIDGAIDDWLGIDPIMATSTTSVYAYVSNGKLQVMIFGEIDSASFESGLWEHFLIDIDQNPDTGNKSWAWSSTLGSDYLVQDGGLFHNNDHGGWSWTEQVDTGLEYARAGTDDSKVIEWSLPLSDLGISEEQTVYIAFLTNTVALPSNTAGEPESLKLKFASSDIEIDIDGDHSDWDEVPLLTESIGGSTKVKAHVDDENRILSMSIYGQIDSNDFEAGLWEHLFIDIDRNPDTGNKFWAWNSTLGSEFLIQSGSIFQGQDDAWIELGSLGMEYARSGSGAEKLIEWSIPFSDLGITDEQTIHVAFLSNTEQAPADVNGDPAAVKLVSVQMDIVIDGDGGDWAEVERGAVSSGGVTEMCVVQDQDKLYATIYGTNLDLRNVYYFDVDQDASTGYQAEWWLNSGAEYKVEQGVLYAYNSEYDSWEQVGSVYTHATTGKLEMYLYLDMIGLSEPGEIKIGFINRGTLQLPGSADEMLLVSKVVQVPKPNNTYYPRESFEVLNNPYMGWVPWARDEKFGLGVPYPQPHSLVYAGISWRELEPERGSFDWEVIEEKYQFDFWANQGKKINLRFVLDYPTNDPSHKDIPDWLYDLLVDEGEPGTWYNTVEIGAGFSPNYNSPTLIAEHERVVEVLGERYGEDSRIAFIQLGSLGHWGEWHTWPVGSGDFPKLSVSDQYVQHYIDHFENKKIGMRKPYPIASENELGLFNDVFGIISSTNQFINWTKFGWDEIHVSVDPGDDPIERQAASAMPDYWKRNYSGGEFANGDAPSFLTDKTIMESLRQVRESHTTWLGPSSPYKVSVGDSIQANMDAMLKTMGYRFVVESVTHSSHVYSGTSLDIQSVWNNKGVAPFYIDWPIEFALANGEGEVVASAFADGVDLREGLPGNFDVDVSLPLPASLPAGQYMLLVAIHDPGTDQPGIELAIAGLRQDGRHELGIVQVADGPIDGESAGGGSSATDRTQHVANPTSELGVIHVRLDSGKEVVTMPAQADAIHVDNQLIVERDGVRVVIPGAVLQQLKEMSGADAHALISVELAMFDENEKLQLIDRVSSKWSADAASGGEGVILKVSIVQSDGSEVRVDQLRAPFELRFSLGRGAERELAGIYEIGKTGGVEYVGGKLSGDGLVVKVDRLGGFAVLTLSKTYSDVPNTHWAYEAIRSISAKHINIDSKANFMPQQKVTRAEFIAVLAEMLELEDAASSPFADVSLDSRFGSAIAAAYQAGIVKGKNGTVFSPNDSLTREEMVAFIMRANVFLYGGDAVEVTRAPFVDYDSFSNWAREFVDSAYYLQLVRGRGNGMFEPQGNVTRAEMAQIVHNFVHE